MLEVSEALNKDGHLQHLHEQLVLNLNALQQSDQFENTMHELTAAIPSADARNSINKASRITENG